jgi:hypothetical protein
MVLNLLSWLADRISALVGRGRRMNLNDTRPGAIVGFAGADDAFAEFEREAFRLRDETSPGGIDTQQRVVASKLKEYLRQLHGVLPEGTTDESLLQYVRETLIRQMSEEEHWKTP